MPECAPCPALAAQAPSAGIKAGLRDKLPIDGKQDDCCCRPRVLNPCYKQPRIPESYAPRRCYQRPTAPVEACTTYKLSYLPADGCVNLRGEARRPPPNLVPSCDPMECATIQRMSYQANPLCVTRAIRPCHHDMWGQGPMQNLTTQRHDYVPKPTCPRNSCRPPAKFHSVETPMENKTINRLSYLPPERCPLPKSFAPERCYEKPCAPMECCTTQKLSYQPVCAPIPQRPPWAERECYQKPCGALESTTIYKASFLPPGEDCSATVDPCCCGDNCQPSMTPAYCVAKDHCECQFPTAAVCK